ncbi:phytanoyl-CoA dioxygenase family protein [Epilithonimonas hungarica]|uniref:Ectoine hydroxylase-related dioxygenase, phytanoyl-CoA dioxygenase (PhyH) family n=1 Tax=Epilithonimonas hungarica TaxID=454006 RepID=A0A1G7NCL1_9FLAO|nr:phytanoyl-CoA dioxygenase family protein [Epilithonimonas hungarica]SDF71069.1 Ectoine hydroxylase-related dioxygenase, phytanoyl-CoA dioxygenase (PhyH) family [Epilithonimonas hungarica]
MMSLIKNSKLSYAFFNIFNRKKLKHNIPLYKKYKINKSYFSPISSKDFRKVESQFKRREDPGAILQTDFYKNQTPENQQSLSQFFDNGYSVVKNFISTEQADQVNSEIQKLLDNNEISFKYGNKLMFALHKSEIIKEIGLEKSLLELLDILLDGKTKLFQSINFINGSQQKTHSDSIHMTTFPVGGLIGVWIALEDIKADQGALHYYPGSHKLPYYMNSDYDNEGNFWMLGNKGNKGYEIMLQEKVKELDLKKEIFECKKGDMLIWHANVLHGGEPHTNKDKTRKSMVFHFFDENSVCYHEITQRPALFEN